MSFCIQQVNVGCGLLWEVYGGEKGLSENGGKFWKNNSEHNNNMRELKNVSVF